MSDTMSEEWLKRMAHLRLAVLRAELAASGCWPSDKTQEELDGVAQCARAAVVAFEEQAELEGIIPRPNQTNKGGRL